jgi:hypothetical protein
LVPTRFLYLAHIFSVFLCGVYLLHEEYDTFVVEKSGTGISAAGALVRLVLAMHWGSEANSKKNLKEGEWAQIMLHMGSLLVSALIFFVGIFVTDGDPENDTVVAVWLVAVIVEQGASIYLLNFAYCDFDANYFGHRMCIWLMLSFGESVISLLNASFHFTPGMVLTTCACFVFITSLCVHYFDVVDCDQYLKHFVFEGKRKTASAFMACHLFWSFTILVIGIGLKGIMYVDLSIEKDNWADHRRRSLTIDLDGFSRIGFVAGVDYASSAITGNLCQRRRLEGWDIADYEWHLNRYFDMVEYGMFIHFFLGNTWHCFNTMQKTKDTVSSVGPPKWRVWFGRISSTLVSLLVVATHTFLKCFKCDPYYEGEEDDHTRRLSAEDDDDYKEGLDIHHALLIIAFISIVSLLLSMMVNQWEPMTPGQLHKYHGHHFEEAEDSKGKHGQPFRAEAQPVLVESAPNGDL